MIFDYFYINADQYIEGRGKDQVGKYSILGELGFDEERFNFIKRYEGILI